MVNYIMVHPLDGIPYKKYFHQNETLDIKKPLQDKI